MVARAPEGHIRERGSGAPAAGGDWIEDPRRDLDGGREGGGGGGDVREHGAVRGGGAGGGDHHIGRGNAGGG
jgi:hypothetical protein